MFLFLVSPIYASDDLTIHITKGASKPYPIAILSFSADGKINQQTAGVITKDLQYSARFLFINENKPSQYKDTSVATLDWQAWRNKKVDYLVFGRVEKQSTGNYKIFVNVASVFGKKSLLHLEYKDVLLADLKVVSHKISDAIYKVITGMPGYFTTHIAYVLIKKITDTRIKYSLVVSDVDGSNAHEVFSTVNRPIASPMWSPDGKRLAYVSYVKHSMAIYMYDLVTKHHHILAHFSGINSAPVWSHNGRYMALALSMGSSFKTNLYVLDIKQSKLAQVTHTGVNTSPTWSFDDKKMAFTSNRGGSPQIYEMFWQSPGEIKRLSYMGVRNFHPLYIRHSHKLVVISQLESDGPLRIGVLDPISGDVDVITHGKLDKSPSVSPNGYMIIYANYDKKNGILEEVSSDGQINIKLPSAFGTVQSPAWSPH